jgi:hypothetical protein
MVEYGSESLDDDEVDMCVELGLKIQTIHML